VWPDAAASAANDASCTLGTSLNRAFNHEMTRVTFENGRRRDP
jgi:hypothetical protein